MTVVDVCATCDRLSEAGYAVIRQALGPNTIGKLENDLECHFEGTPFCEGDFYGPSTKRFGSLLIRSPHTEALVRHPAILEIANRVLGPHCDRFALNLTQAVEIHPGAPAQFPHRDHDMWSGPKGEIEYLINFIWPLTPFRFENGGTRLWSGSHRNFDEEIADKADAVVPELDPGDALVFLGSTLHGGGANSGDATRRGIIISYSLGWLKPFELQWLVYPPHIAKRFDPELAALIGYAQHRPNLGNVEGQCPSILLCDQVPNHIAATDALRPDQAEMLADYLAERRK